MTRKLLRDAAFCHSVELRVNAATDIVEQLPATSPDIEVLLGTAPYEIRYTVLNALDSLPLRPVDVKRLLPSVLRVLDSTNSRIAFVWMKVGCLLGDGFLRAADKDTRAVILTELAEALRSARSVHARYGAFHGIEHALNTASSQEGKTMLDAVYETALSDRALSLRRSAYSLLHDGYWWGNNGLRELHTYARRYGRKLRIHDYY
jgi:hypothetical protein